MKNPKPRSRQIVSLRLSFRDGVTYQEMTTSEFNRFDREVNSWIINSMSEENNFYTLLEEYLDLIHEGPDPWCPVEKLSATFIVQDFIADVIGELLDAGLGEESNDYFLTISANPNKLDNPVNNLVQRYIELVACADRKAVRAEQRIIYGEIRKIILMDLIKLRKNSILY